MDILRCTGVIHFCPTWDAKGNLRSINTRGQTEQTMKLCFYLIIVFGSVLIGGCAGPTEQNSSRQYCHTSQEIRTRNSATVDSQTTINCQDGQPERFRNVRTGVSPSCFEAPYQVELPNGRIIRGMNYACPKKGGGWDIIDGRTVN